MPRLPSLMEELVEEILLRLPPDDPGSLLRAALVCKSWCRLISNAGFNRRFREFHWTMPPVLGFFCGIYGATRTYSAAGDPSFLPLTSFPCLPYAFMPTGAPSMPAMGSSSSTTDMARLHVYVKPHLIVWNPSTGHESRLPVVPIEINRPMDTWDAALFCNDVVDSGLGMFQVAVVTTAHGFTSACVYSSEQQVWSTPICSQHPGDVHHLGGRNALVGNTLCFKCNKSWILEYDMSKQELSLISLPPSCKHMSVALMTVEDGGLGFAMHDTQLQTVHVVKGDGDSRWTQQKDFELHKPLPFTVSAPRVRAVANDFSFVFIWTTHALVIVDLKFRRVRKTHDLSDVRGIYGIVPYMGFCTPVVGSHLYEETRNR